jgi:Peptidase family C25
MRSASMNERPPLRHSTPVALPPDPIVRSKPPGFSHFFLPVFLIVATNTMAGERVPGREAARALAVIGPERFHQAIKPFLTYRNKQRPTEWASLESILKSTEGTDDPERLKHWLYRGWKERGLHYVLLVGDADLVPVRYMVLDRVTPPAFDYAFYPSDLYYADIARRDGTFDDWNARKDDFHAGYYGEVRGEKNKSSPINFDRIDYRAELAVGRWPVDSPDEVRIVAEKTIAAERSALAEHGYGLRRAALVYVPGWVDPRGRMDGWAATLPGGWTALKMFGGEPNSAPDAKRIVQMLNEGASLVVHAGHGDDNGWAGSINIKALGRVHNEDRLPVVISVGCSTARFATLPPYEAYEDVLGARHKGTDSGEVFRAPPPPPSPYARGTYNPTGLGERMVRGGHAGAVAYIGCNTGGQPCALTLVDGFFGALHDLPEPTLGECWIRAIDHYFHAEHLDMIKPDDGWYPPSIFFQGMKYMVFGDPALRLPSPVKR